LSPEEAFGTEAYVFQAPGVYASRFVKVTDPYTLRPVLIPRGQFDATHDSTIACPYCRRVLRPVGQPPPPGEVAYPLRERPMEMMDVSQPGSYRLRVQYYCSNPSCVYYLRHAWPYEQERVEVELQAARG